MRIVLPWPDRRLSPNARTHWRVKADAIRKARHDACYAVLEAMECGLREARHAYSGGGAIKVEVTFYPPDKRRRDDDNLVGSFKASRDGIADALAVDDRRFSPSYIFAEPCKPGRIEVAIG